jgi:DNA polymerase III delta subunit
LSSFETNPVRKEEKKMAKLVVVFFCKHVRKKEVCAIVQEKKKNML